MKRPMKSKTHGIVVDASVARSAGESRHPVSSACRGFLNRMRGYLRACASTVKPLRPIAWVNPANPAETPLDWLDAGAPCEPSRMLGADHAAQDASP